MVYGIMVVPPPRGVVHLSITHQQKIIDPLFIVKLQVSIRKGPPLTPLHVSVGKKRRMKEDEIEGRTKVLM